MDLDVSITTDFIRKISFSELLKVITAITSVHDSIQNTHSQISPTIAVQRYISRILQQTLQ